MLSRNLVFFLKLFVAFCALVSFILTTKMFLDWWDESSFFSLPGSIGLILELGKIICTGCSVKMIFKNGFNWISGLTGVMAGVFLGVSAMASNYFLTISDHRYEKSSIESSMIYQTSKPQIDSLMVTIKNKRALVNTYAANENELDLNKEKTKRLFREIDQHQRKIEELSNGLSNIRSEGRLSRMGFDKTGAQFVYWFISIMIEMCSVVGLLLIKHFEEELILDEEEEEKKKSPSPIDYLDQNSSLSKKKSFNLSSLHNRSAPVGPDLKKISEELFPKKNQQLTSSVRRNHAINKALNSTIDPKILKNDCEEAVRLMKHGCRPTYESIGRKLGRSNAFMSKVFQCLRENGILVLHGKKHIFVESEAA